MSVYGCATRSSDSRICRYFKTPSSNAQRNISAAAKRTAFVSEPSSMASIVCSNRANGPVIVLIAARTSTILDIPKEAE